MNIGKNVQTTTFVPSPIVKALLSHAVNQIKNFRTDGSNNGSAEAHRFLLHNLAHGDNGLVVQIKTILQGYGDSNSDTETAIWYIVRSLQNAQMNHLRTNADYLEKLAREKPQLPYNIKAFFGEDIEKYRRILEAEFANENTSDSADDIGDSDDSDDIAIECLD